MSHARFVPVVVAGLVLALAIRSHRGAVAACDVFRFPCGREEVDSEEALSESLDLVSADIRRRVAIKEALVSDLIAGRASLACATEQFLALGQGRPEYLRVVRANCPGDTDLEKTAHNVMGFVEAELSSRPPEQQEAVRNRLRAELSSLFPTPRAIEPCGTSGP